MPYVGKSEHLHEAPSDHLADRTHSGQASWANNYGKECETCDFARKAPRGKGFITCAEFHRLMGRPGLQFPQTATACRFHTPKVDRPEAAPAPIDTKRISGRVS